MFGVHHVPENFIKKYIIVPTLIIDKLVLSESKSGGLTIASAHVSRVLLQEMADYKPP